MVDERAAALARFDDAWRQMRSRFDQLAVQERAGRQAEAPVSLAQAIRHVADWDRFAVDSLRAGATTEDDADDLPDGVRNARWLAEDFYVSLDDALGGLDGAHGDRRAAMDALDVDTWEHTSGGWIEAGTWHYRDHADDPFDFPIDLDESIAILDRRRTALLERLRAGIDRDEATAARGGITLAAAIAHLARWDAAAVEVLDARRRNADAPDPYVDRDREWNARWLHQDADIQPRAALERFEDASTRLLATLRAADEALWRRDGPRFALGTAEHYRSHTEQPLEFPLPE